MTLIITGASGFIGSHLIRMLREGGNSEEIINLDLCPERRAWPGLRSIQVDLRDAEAVAALALPPARALIHLAALCKEPGYPWEDYFRANHMATKLVARLADRLGIRNLVFTSTMMVFKAGDKRMAEDDPCAPDTAYGLSKLLAEEALTAWRAQGDGRRLRMVRPGVVFGQGERGNYTRLVRAVRRRRFAYIGRSTTVKGSIYVKDLGRLVLQLLDDVGSDEIYHGVTFEPTTIADIVAAICRTHGIKRWIPTVPYGLAYGLSLPFALSDPLTSTIHPRRIQKLYLSTNLSSERLRQIGFDFTYGLQGGLDDWRKDCGPGDLI